MAQNKQLYLRSDLIQYWSENNAFELARLQQGEIFRSKEGRRTLRFKLGDKSYFLKLHQGVGWGEIVKNLLQLRLPIIGAKNEWEAIHFLEKHQLDTMKIAAYGQQGFNPAKTLSFLVTDELVDTMNLEYLGEQWRNTLPKFGDKAKLIRKIALIAKKMHENGMNHRDFYLCHFLLDKSFEKTNSIENETKLFLIDLHRAQIRKKVPQRWLVKDIGSLYFSALEIDLTQRDLFRFMAAYSGKSLRDTLFGQERFWSKVQQRAVKLRDK